MRFSVILLSFTITSVYTGSIGHSIRKNKLQTNEVDEDYFQPEQAVSSDYGDESGYHSIADAKAILKRDHDDTPTRNVDDDDGDDEDDDGDGRLNESNTVEKDNEDAQLTLNSEPIRPPLGLKDRANLLQIESYLKAIRSKLTDMEQADRDQQAKSGLTSDEILSESIIHHGKTVDNVPNVKNDQHVHNGHPVDNAQPADNDQHINNGHPVDNGQPVDNAHHIDNGYPVDNDNTRLLDNVQTEDNAKEINNGSPAGSDQHKDVAHGFDSAKDIHEEVNDVTSTTSTYPPSSKPYEGFNPKSVHDSTPKNEQVTASPTHSTTSHSAHVRDISQTDKTPSFKDYLADSFIKVFDIVKVSLLKMNADMEDEFKQLYNLETDHYNMATGDIRANGDKVDRLQQFVTREVSALKYVASNLTRTTLDLSRNIQTTLAKILNVTETVLSATRVINDRTERIMEIKDKEMKLALTKSSVDERHKEACLKQHIKNKGLPDSAKKLEGLLHVHHKSKHPHHSSVNQDRQRPKVLENLNLSHIQSLLNSSQIRTTQAPKKVSTDFKTSSNNVYRIIRKPYKSNSNKFRKSGKPSTSKHRQTNSRNKTSKKRAKASKRGKSKQNHKTRRKSNKKATRSSQSHRRNKK